MSCEPFRVSHVVDGCTIGTSLPHLGYNAVRLICRVHVAPSCGLPCINGVTAVQTLVNADHKCQATFLSLSQMRYTIALDLPISGVVRSELKEAWLVGGLTRGMVKGRG